MKSYRPPRPPGSKDWRYQGTSNWRRHRRWFFWRFIMSFAMLVFLLAGLLAILARLFAPIFGGGHELTRLVMVSGCGLFLLLPLLLVGSSLLAMRRFGTPIAKVMAVTEAVADGDLSARVETNVGGRFGQLSGSINNMVAELERTAEQRRRLTADIAHELRTPLHIIQGNLEGILDGVYAPTEAHIQNTLEETQLLARLVEDLGTLSLAEAGELPLSLEPVAVTELLEDVATSFSGQADAAGVRLEVDVAPDMPAVAGDVMRLTQVLANLVANALRYTPAGGLIQLTAEAADDAVQLRVADTGQGIPAADVPHIFDRFWRGDPARTHAGGAGGGLGLAIARQLVEAHGGTIAVSSAAGQGTTFTIELPVTAAGAGAAGAGTA